MSKKIILCIYFLRIFYNENCLKFLKLKKKKKNYPFRFKIIDSNEKWDLLLVQVLKFIIKTQFLSHTLEFPHIILFHDYAGIFPQSVL